MPWVCSDSYCREDYSGPNGHSYYGNVIIDCEDSVEEITDVCCSNCGARTEWCDYCSYDSYCGTHNSGSSGEVRTSQFSADINWVSKPKQTAQ